MSLKFSCRCGQHLKARETSAGRLTQCPRCGGPVAIPLRQPTHRGVQDLPGSTPGRTDFQSVLRPAPQRESSPRLQSPSPPRKQGTRSAADHAALPLGRSASSTRRSTRRPIDHSTDADIRLRRIPHWWRLCDRQARHAVTCTISFGFSLGALPVLLGLGALLGLAGGVWLRLLPDALQHSAGPWGNPFFALVTLGCCVLAGYCASVLNRALAAATRARGEATGPVKFGLDSAVVALAVWIGCFLAGPIVPASAAYVYWMQCGDPAALDWIIVAELLVPAMAYWLAALTVVQATGRIAEATPARVIDVLWRLGWRGWLTTLISGTLTAGWVAGIVVAARLIHQDDPAGYLVLILSSAGSVFAQGVLLRGLAQAWSRLPASPLSQSRPPKLAPGVGQAASLANL